MNQTEPQDATEFVGIVRRFGVRAGLPPLAIESTVPFIVRLKGPHWVVSVCFDARCHELDLTIQRCSSPTREATLAELIRHLRRESSGFAIAAVATVGDVSAELDRLADIMRAPDFAALLGDPNQLDQALSRIALMRDRETQVRQLAGVSHDARAAFRRADFQAVITLLGPFESIISPSQRKMMSIAKSRNSVG